MMEDAITVATLEIMDDQRLGKVTHFALSGPKDLKEHLDNKLYLNGATIKWKPDSIEGTIRKPVGDALDIFFFISLIESGFGKVALEASVGPSNSPYYIFRRPSSSPSATKPKKPKAKPKSKTKLEKKLNNNDDNEKKMNKQQIKKNTIHQTKKKIVKQLQNELENEDEMDEEDLESLSSLLTEISHKQEQFELRKKARKKVRVQDYYDAQTL